LFELAGLQYLKAYYKSERYFRIRSLHTDYPVSLGVVGKTFEQSKIRPKLRVSENILISEPTLDRIALNMNYMREYK
jgi:hypothetical protein